MEEETAVRRGVVAVAVRQSRFLVIRRSERVVAPGMYCFPGGGIAENECEEQAVVREMREEVGVDVLPIRRLWRSVTPWGVPLAWWHVALPDDFTFGPNPDEVAFVGWMTLEELAARSDLLESNRQFLAALRVGEIVLDLTSS